MPSGEYPLTKIGILFLASTNNLFIGNEKNTKLTSSSFIAIRIKSVSSLYLLQLVHGNYTKRMRG